MNGDFIECRLGWILETNSTVLTMIILHEANSTGLTMIILHNFHNLLLLPLFNENWIKSYLAFRKSNINAFTKIYYVVSNKNCLANKLENNKIHIKIKLTSLFLAYIN